jgi:hypothetical protein
MKKYELEGNLNSKNYPVVVKPSSEWRKGDEAVFESSKVKEPTKQEKTQVIIDKILSNKKNTNKKDSCNSNNNIYPQWWGDPNKCQSFRMNKTKVK